MAEPYVITRDSHRRLHANLTDKIGVSFRLLPEDHPRRVTNNVHAYVVMDIMIEVNGTPCQLVVRDIKVVKNPEYDRFAIHYRQWEPMGRSSGSEPRFLDVAGPLDRTSRSTLSSAILAVFFQIKEEAAAGTLCRPGMRQPKEPVNPVIAASLESIAERLGESERQQEENSGNQAEEGE